MPPLEPALLNVLEMTAPPRPRERAPIRLERLDRLQGLTEALSAALTPEEVAAIIFDRGLDLVGARAVVLFWERGPGELELLHGLGLSDAFVQRYRRIPADAPLPPAAAYRTGEPVWLGSPQEIARRFPAAADAADAEGDRACAALPLVVERARGAIGLTFDSPRSFDDDERAFVLAVSRQCAQALERAQLFRAEKQLADRVRSLQRATAELSAAVTPGEVAAIAFRHLLGLGAGAAVIYLADATGEALELAYAHGVTDDARRALARVSRGASDPVAQAFRAGAPVWVHGAETGYGAAPGLSAAGEPTPDMGWGAIPLRGEAGTFGALAFSSAGDRALGEAQQGDAVALAQQCAVALERARLFEAEKRRAERLARVQSISAALAGAATPAEIAAAASGAVEALGASGAEIHALEGMERLVLLARSGAPTAADALTVALDAPVPAAEVVRTGKAIWASRAELAERFPRWATDPARAAAGAWAIVPLLAAGNTLGALAVAFADARTLHADERAFVRLVAQPCAQALERARLFEVAARTRREAEWNAAVLDAMFARAPVALALLDKDLRFARVNRLLARIDGVPAEDHVGRSPIDLFPGLPGDQLREAFRRVLETNTSLATMVEGETPAAPGETRRFAMTWYPVRVGGAPVGVGVMVVEER